MGNAYTQGNLTYGITDREIFTSLVNSHTAVDIGFVESLAADGKATIALAQFVSGKQVKLVGAEIIYPGNASGAYKCCTPGTTCLVFLPRSCVPQVTEQGILYTASSNSSVGAKAMPISTGMNAPVDLSINDAGELNVQTDFYRMNLTQDCVTMDHGDKLWISKNGDGSITGIYEGAEKDEHVININDESITYRHINNDASVVDTTTINPDGSKTLVQAKPQNDKDPIPRLALTLNADSSCSLIQSDASGDEAKPLLTLTLNADSSYSLSQTDKDGNVLSSFSVDTEGALSIEVKGATSLTLHDNLTVDATADSKDIELKANNIKLSAGADITVDASSNVKVTGALKVNDTNLTVDK